MIVDKYQATTSTESQKRLREMEEENEKLRNDNKKLKTMLIRGMYHSYFTGVMSFYFCDFFYHICNSDF